MIDFSKIVTKKNLLLASSFIGEVVGAVYSRRQPTNVFSIFDAPSRRPSYVSPLERQQDLEAEKERHQQELKLKEQEHRHRMEELELKLRLKEAGVKEEPSDETPTADA